MCQSTTYPLSKRFGVVQGEKIRCVDDFSRSGVKKPHTLDVLAGLCLELMGSCQARYSWF